MNPSYATGILERLSSPWKSTAEVGSRSIALHTFPKAVMTLALWESTVGYAFMETVNGSIRDPEKAIRPDIPDRPCPKIWSVPPVSVSESLAVAAR